MTIHKLDKLARLNLCFYSFELDKMDSTAWLQTENKVRALIKDLIEPTVRRVTDSAKQLEKLAQIQSSIVFKIEDVDLAVENLEKKFQTLDEYSKKINEFEGNQMIMESQFNREREEIRSEVSRFTKQLGTFQENLEVLQHQRDFMKEEITVTQHSVVNVKYELEQKFSSLQSKQLEIITSVDGKIMQIEGFNLQFKKNIEKIGGEISNLDAEIKDVGRMALQAGKDCKEIKKRMEKNKEENEKEIERTKGMCLNISGEVSKIAKEVRMLDRAFKTDETWIRHEVNKTDPLYQVISDLPQLKVLAVYDKERLEKLDLNKYSQNIAKIVSAVLKRSETIITTPLPDPKQLKKMQPVTESEKKKKKLRKEIKKKIAQQISQASKDLSRGKTSNLDSNSLKFQMLPTKNLLDPESSLSKPKSVRNLEKVPSDLKIAEKKVDILEENENYSIDSLSSDSNNTDSDDSDSDSESLIDFSPMIEQVKLQLQQEAHYMYLELKSSIDTNAESSTFRLSETRQELSKNILSVGLKHDDFTGQVKKTIGEIEIAVQQAIYECNSASLQRKREHNDKESMFKTISMRLDDVLTRESLINDTCEQLSSTIDCLIDYCKISMALQSQDETDRESIALMGYKKKRHQNVITVDKRCLSCAGQSSAVLAAFKIACLAYEPSIVYFQNHKFTRKELLRLQNRVLQSFSKSPQLDLSDESRDIQNTTMLTSKQWRPLSVPPSRFSTLTSPHEKASPECEVLPMLRKSLKFNS